MIGYKLFVLFVLFTTVFSSINELKNVEEIFQSRDPAIINNCTTPKISKRTTFIFSVIPFTGTLAIDRFFSRWIDIGLIKLLLGLFCDSFTCGLFSIVFWIIDFVSLIQGTIMYRTDGDGCPFIEDFNN